jgi:hypothetical protein
MVFKYAITNAKLVHFHPETSGEHYNTGEILCTFPPPLIENAKAQTG